MKEIELIFPKFKNEESMTESEICLACHGCCSYISVVIESPRSKDQRDSYGWYLSHRNVEIYIDHDNDWNLLFKTPCNHLLPNGACGVYETRFDICREYEADSCSRTGSDCKILFKSSEELYKYLDDRKTTNAKKKSDKKSSLKKKTVKRKKTA
jgi:hypothetical protein